MDSALAEHLLWVQRRAQVRRAWIVRLSGYAIVAAALAWLAVVEASALIPASALMAVGATIAVASAAWIARKEATAASELVDGNRGIHAQGKQRRTFRLLVGGYALKLWALPLVALGGGWLAWPIGPGFEAALGVAGLGVCAYAYGIVARIEGLSLLDGVPT